MSEVERKTGTRDVAYDLISVSYHALQGGETYMMYVEDAQQAGDTEAEQFFRGVIEEERRRADRAKELLRTRLG